MSAPNPASVTENNRQAAVVIILDLSTWWLKAEFLEIHWKGGEGNAAVSHWESGSLWGLMQRHRAADMDGPRQASWTPSKQSK